MTEERKILEMLQAGQINIDEALGLLEAIRDSATHLPFKHQANDVKDLHWLAIQCLSGDVRMRLNRELNLPNVVKGPALENGRLGTQTYVGDIEVELPENYGVNLEVKKGNIRAEGIAFVRGKVGFGQATVDKVRGADLQLHLGNVNANLLLTPEAHSLNFQEMLR